MASHHGKNGALYMSVSGTGPLALVGQVSEWSLDMATDTVETTSLGSTNKTYVLGLKDLKGSFATFWDDVSDAIFDAADSPTGCKLAFYPSLLVPTQYWTGPAWVSASIKLGVTAAVTVDGTFVANGSWSRAPVVFREGSADARVAELEKQLAELEKQLAAARAA